MDDMTEQNTIYVERFREEFKQTQTISNYSVQRIQPSKVGVVQRNDH